MINLVHVFCEGAVILRKKQDYLVKYYLVETTRTSVFLKIFFFFKISVILRFPAIFLKDSMNIDAKEIADRKAEVFFMISGFTIRGFLPFIKF